MAKKPKLEIVNLDGEEFVVERELPVFHSFAGVSEHDGKPFAITEEDLPEIAERTAKLIEKDLKIINLIGHRKSAKDADEREQPAPIGMWLNPKVGQTPDGKPAVVMDSYTHRNHWDEAKKHPFRSPEFSLARKEIRAVSRLTRNPRMDSLGSNLYFQDGEQLIRFAMDDAADLDESDDAVDEASELDEAENDSPKPEKEEASILDEQIMAAMIDQLLGNEEFLAKLKAALGSKEAKPAPEMKAEEKFSGEQLETFAEIKKENELLRKEVNSLLEAKVEAECKAMLSGLESFSMDEARELEMLKKLAPEKRAGHIDYIKANYRPKPGKSEPLHLFQGAAPDLAKGQGRPDPAAIVAYATKKQVSFDEAEKALMGNIQAA